MIVTKRALFLIAIPAISLFFTERFSSATEDWQLPDAQEEIRDAEEIELGKHVDEYIRHQFYLEEDPDFNQAVNNIIQRVVAVSERNTIPITCAILQSLSINAFSAPGGHIYLTYGLLKFAQTEDEVAGIVGHEVAHLSLRHATKLYREVMEINSHREEGTHSTTKLLLLHSHLEEFEQDADTKGILYAQKAGFNPKGLLDFLERHLDFMIHRRFFGMIDSGFNATITARLNHLRECLANLEKSNN